jgi:hypothetical protein
MPVEEMVANVGGKSDRAAFPVHFTLLDDDHQASLPIDHADSGTHPLTLHITNRSGVDLEWLPAPGESPTKDFHHLEIEFRPGVLSKTTLDSLKRPEELLAQKDRADWRITDSGLQEDGTHALLLLFTPQDKTRLKLRPGGSLKVRLQRILASQATPHGLTKVELRLNNVSLDGLGEIDSHSTRRHCHLSVGLMGGLELPLRIGFEGHALLRGDRKEDDQKLTLIVLNRTKDPVGRAIDGNPAQLVLSFDLKGPWGTETESLKVVSPNKIKVKFPDDSETGINDPSYGLGLPAHWTIVLPEAGIPPARSDDKPQEIKCLRIEMDGIKASGEGTVNVYVDGSDIPGFRTRVILPVTVSNVTPAAFQGIQDALKKHQYELQELKEDFQGVLTSLRRLATLAEASDLPGRDDSRAPVLISETDSCGILPRIKPMVPAHYYNKDCRIPCRIPSGQLWGAVVGGSPVDVSARFVLLNIQGAVCRFLAGRRLRDNLPLPPKSSEPFVEIGELLGAPLLLRNDHKLYVWDIYNSGEWTEWVELPWPVLHVGEGWIAVNPGDGVRLLSASICCGPGVPRFLGALPPDGPAGIAEIGGTASDPLVVDPNGKVWWLLRPAKPAEVRLGIWHPDTELFDRQHPQDFAGYEFPTVADMNSLGVIIRKDDKRVYRWGLNNRKFGWHDTNLPVTARRIGGTWRNPVVIGTDGNMYWLEDKR